MFSYDYYRIFYYVAKYRSFTQAANVLFNNQPNLTRSVRNLESSLGCTLFVRSNRGVRLTPEGEKLYEHVRIAFEHIQAGEEALQSDRGLHSGAVSVGVSETALHCLLLSVFKEFHRLYPGIRLKISNNSTPQAIEALKNGLVDFAVVTTPIDNSKTFSVREIQTFREVAVCGGAFSFLAEETLSLRRLSEYPLICLGTQTKTYGFYAQLFLQQGITLMPDIEATTVDQILPMVRSDLGIGFVPEQLVREMPNSKDVFVLRLEEPIPERKICLVKRTDQSLSVAAKVLERTILDAVEKQS